MEKHVAQLVEMVCGKRNSKLDNKVHESICRALALHKRVPHFSSNRHALPTRLDPVGPFAQRMSPLVSPSSPASNSPLSAGLSAASYERDKRHEREPDHLMLQAPLGPEQSFRMGKPSGYMARDAPF